MKEAAIVKKFGDAICEEVVWRSGALALCFFENENKLLQQLAM